MRLRLSGRQGKPKRSKAPASPLCFEVVQSGNTVRIVGPDIEIFVAVEGIDLPGNVDCSFAVWLTLPIAMRRGADLHVDAPVDPVVVANAQKLSSIWQMWVPERFSAVRVTGRDWRPQERARSEALTLFSGGVDSAYALLKNSSGVAGRRRVLTIQGLDYAGVAGERFARLLAKTDPLLDRLNCERIVLRTNLTDHVRSLEFTHGFILAGGLFLFRDLFARGYLAADYTPEMEMLVFPWGTNHVTNAYFAGSDFSVESLAADVTRTEKIRALSNDALACSTLSFCREPSAQPDNCGRCRKCLLTKIRFQAVTGRVPPIFLDPALTAADVLGIDLDERAAYAAFAEIAAEAGPLGLLDRVPGFEAHLADFRPGRRHRGGPLSRLFSRIRDRRPQKPKALDRSDTA